MSIKLMSWVWAHSPYEHTQLLIHLACADWASDEGQFWPSQESIARKCRCSDRYVRDTLDDMEANGLLESRKRQRTSNMYRLLTVNKGGTPISGGTADGPDSYPELSADLTGTPEPQTGTPTPVEPSVEPSEEPSEVLLAPAVQDEPELVPVSDQDGWWEDETVRPKWQAIPANVMKYAAPFGRKWFKDRAERRMSLDLIAMTSTGRPSSSRDSVSQEWVDTVLGWATAQRFDGGRGTRWSFSGFLRVATDTEKYRDWEIRKANATGGQEKIPTTLDEIDRAYG